MSQRIGWKTDLQCDLQGQVRLCNKAMSCHRSSSSSRWNNCSACMTPHQSLGYSLSNYLQTHILGYTDDVTRDINLNVDKLDVQETKQDCQRFTRRHRHTPQGHPYIQTLNLTHSLMHYSTNLDHVPNLYLYTFFF